MSRLMSSEMIAASQEAVVRPVYLARLDYISAPILVCSAPFSMFWDWNGDGSDNEFIGVGNLGAVSEVEEGAELQSYSMTLEMSGLDTASLAIALGEHYQQRDARIWLALLDENNEIIGAPTLKFRGRIDTQEIDFNQSTISVTIASRLLDWQRPRIRRFTNQDQQAVYPGDKGLEFVAQMEEKELLWGTN